MAKLTLQILETKLWDCADILRGTLNSSQYMEYIFGMLFLKRINDQFDVERSEKQVKFAKLPPEALEKELENARSYKTFFIPKQARWQNFKDLNLNIGAELDKALKLLKMNQKIPSWLGYSQQQTTMTRKECLTVS